MGCTKLCIIILAYCLTGSNPYPGIENRKILGLLKRGYRMPQPPECPDDMLVNWYNVVLLSLS